MEHEAPCTRCGACCRRAGTLEAFVVLGWADAGGACKFLLENNDCAIYETRPDICRVAAVHQAMRPDQTWEQYARNNVAACNAMMAEDKIAESFRIEVEP